MTKHEKTIGQKVDEIANETKKISNGLEKWWTEAPLENRIATLIWGFLILIALWNLKGILWQIGILVIGILSITWMFDDMIKKSIVFIKEQCKNCSSEKKSEKIADKEEEKNKESDEEDNVPAEKEE